MLPSLPQLLICASTIVLTCLIVYCLMKAWRAQDAKSFLALAISIIALTFSVWATWKDQVWPCKPTAVFSGFLFGRLVPSESSFKVAFPITFINRGYGPGIIESVYLQVLTPGDDEAIRYDVHLEIDLSRFIQDRRYLHAENLVGPFLPFKLAGKDTVTKTLTFVPPKHQKMKIAAGTYMFAVVARCRGKDHPLFSYAFKLDEEVLTDVTQNNVSVFWLANNTWIRFHPNAGETRDRSPG